MSRPDSIRSLGLERHLNITKDLHNDRGYAELVKYISIGDELGEPLPVTRMARAFNVTPITMDKWLIIYHEEKRSDKDLGAMRQIIDKRVKKWLN